MGAPRQSSTLQTQRPHARNLAVGVIVCPGSGISANLADKAKMLGIPVWRLGKCGA
jgi:hypothetical protein